MARESGSTPLRNVTQPVDTPPDSERRVLAERIDQLLRCVEQLTLAATEGERAEQGLRASEERLKLAQSAANIGVWDWNIRADVASCSEQYHVLYGSPPSEQMLSCEEWFACIHPEDRQRAGREVRDAVACDAPYETEYRVVWPDGSVHWLYSKARVVFEDGQAVRMIGVNIDITRRKQDEERLSRYRAQLRELASALALAEEQERRRIAGLLHDRTMQGLALSLLKLGQLRHALPEDGPHALLDETRELVQQAIHDTRTLVFELSPPILYELGLVPALEWLCTHMQDERGGRYELLADDDGPLPGDLQVVLFQIVRELLVNTAKHAQASHTQVRLARSPRELRISVEDDGVGFDPEALTEHGAHIAGYGLFSIRERMDVLGGRMEIDSEPGRGTRITLVALRSVRRLQQAI